MTQFQDYIKSFQVNILMNTMIQNKKQKKNWASNLGLLT